MIESNLILCAEGVIRDAETNNISIFNILEELTAESYPILIQKSALFTVLTKEEDDPDKPDLKFLLFNNDELVNEHKLKVDFRGKTKSRTIIRLGGIPFHNPGKAHFKVIDSDENEIAKYSINLKLREDVEVTST